MMNLDQRSATLRPNEGEHAIFQLSTTQSLRIVHGCLTREIAEAIVVPTNTAIAASGAAAAAFSTVNSNPSILFPHLNVQDPLALDLHQITIDLKIRPRVGELGSAAASISLPDTAQGWKRIIAAFVRHQNNGEAEDTLSDHSIASALRSSLQICSTLKLNSVVTVPFGTGALGITAGESARSMFGVIRELASNEPTILPTRLTVVADLEGHFASFVREARLTIKNRARMV